MACCQMAPSLYLNQRWLSSHSMPWVTLCLQFFSMPTSDIWGKERLESVRLDKCTRWPFNDFNPGSWLCNWWPKVCLSAWWNENHSSKHYKTWYTLPMFSFEGMMQSCTIVYFLHPVVLLIEFGVLLPLFAQSISRLTNLPYYKGLVCLIDEVTLHGKDS